MSHRQQQKNMPMPGSILLRAALAVAALVMATPLTAFAQSAVESAGVRSVGASTATAAKPTAAANARVASAAGGTSGRSGTASAPVQSAIDAGPSCIGGLPQPTPVRINAGKSTLINLPEPITRRTLGDPKVVDSQLVSPQVLYLVSGNIGSTNAILQGRSGRCIVLDIVVGIDTDAVQSKIAELLPTEKNIRVTAAGDSLILTGTVADTIAGERAVSIANAYVRTRYQQGFTGGAAATGAGSQVTVNGAAPLAVRVVNMLTVTAPQQVMLEVKVAEISKKLIDRLGVSVAGAQYRGSWTYKLVSDFLLGGAAATGSAIRNSENGIAFEADKRDGLVRILAEPTLLAISGQEGSFLAGGRIFIPVPQSGGVGGTVVTLQEETFGVGLKFTPTVLADGRINLQVAPEVSELSPTGAQFSTGQLIGGTSVLPLISTRRASTTVQLFDGQSFAIGGLIRSNSAGAINAFPILGELPIIGALFRSSDFQEEKTELVFVITPRLVKPLPPDYQLPTDRIGAPTREGVLLEGRLDSAPQGAEPASAAPSGPKTTGGMELK